MSTVASTPDDPAVHLLLTRPVTRSTLLAVTATFGLFLYGCSGPAVDAAVEWHGTIDTLANGTVRVSNPGYGRWDEGEAWRLTEDLRIGDVDADGPYQFGQITQVAFGPRGQILVLDGQAQEVRTFDGRGRHVRTIGREGGGPGELRGAIGLSWDSEHNLWVTEVGNARYSVFDCAGTYLTSHRRDIPGVVQPWVGGFGVDGMLYDVLGRGAPDGTFHFVYYAMDGSASVEDSLPALAYAPSAAAAVPGSASLLAPRLTFRLDPAGSIWFGMTNEYVLYQRDFGGDTIRIVTRAIDRETFSEAEKDSMLAEAARYVPITFPRSQLPEVRPVFQRLIVDDAGRLWVQRSPRPQESATTFDLFAADGIFLGEVHSPVELEWMTPAVLRGDYLLGVTTDSLGVPHAIRLRIERPGEARE